VAHTTDGPRGGILDEDVRVRQRRQDEGYGLIHARPDGVVARTIEDGTDGHNRRLLVSPVIGLDVLPDEGHDARHDGVLDGIRDQLQAGGAAHARIPLVIVDLRLLVLPRQQLRENRHEFIARRADVSEANALGRGALSRLRQLRGHVVELHLLLGQRAP